MLLFIGIAVVFFPPFQSHFKAFFHILVIQLFIGPVRVQAYKLVHMIFLAMIFLAGKGGQFFPVVHIICKIPVVFYRKTARIQVFQKGKLFFADAVEPQGKISLPAPGSQGIHTAFQVLGLSHGKCKHVLSVQCLKYYHIFYSAIFHRIQPGPQINVGKGVLAASAALLVNVGIDILSVFQLRLFKLYVHMILSYPRL